MSTAILDVAIGLILAYLLTSLICTAIQEYIAAKLRWRAKDLKAGLVSILAAPAQPESEGAGAAEQGEAAADQKPDLAAAFLAHPLISGMSQAPATGFLSKLLAPVDTILTVPRRRAQGPSYLSSDLFCKALIDVLGREAEHAIRTYDDLHATVANLPDGPVRARLLAIAENTDASLDRAIDDIEDFFDATMDRVSGWYKRRSQAVLFTIALVVAVVLNVNSIRIAKTLYQDPALRQQVVTQAEAIVAEPGDTSEAGAKPAGAETIKPTGETAAPAADMTAPAEEATATGDPVVLTGTPGAAAGAPEATSGDPPPPNDTIKKEFTKSMDALAALPIGWAGVPTKETFAKALDDKVHALSKLVGWLATAIAASLGAPFWFNMLNGALRIRAAGARPLTAVERRAAAPPAAPSAPTPVVPLSPADPIHDNRYPTGPASPFERTSLSADDIKDLQEALGMGDDQVTGALDLPTRIRIAEYQQQYGQEITGVITQKLATTLLGS